MYCGKCGKKLVNGERMCPFCGYEQEVMKQWKGISLDFISDKEKEDPLERSLKSDEKLSDARPEEEIFSRPENLESPLFAHQDTKGKSKQNKKKQKKVSGISGQMKILAIICVICVSAFVLLSGIYIRALQSKNNNLMQKLERMEIQLQDGDKKFNAMKNEQKVQENETEAQKKQINKLKKQIAEIKEYLDMDTGEENFFDVEEPEREKRTEVAMEDELPESTPEVIDSDGYSQEDYSSDEQ